MTFQIKSNKKETENKTIRFPLGLIEKINTATNNGQDISFSGFVIQACEYALESMETSQDEKSQTSKF